MIVIDLDEPAEDRPVTHHLPWRRWRRLISAAALLVVGGMVGAGATYRWDSQRDERAAESAVAVLAVPGALTWAGKASVSFPAEGEPQTVVSMAGWLSVVNAGPKRIQLRDLIFDQPGTTLFSNDVLRWIEPLEASTVEVVAEMQCQTSAPRDARLSLTVKAADATVRTSAAEWDSSLWDGERDRACAENEPA